MQIQARPFMKGFYDHSKNAYYFNPDGNVYKIMRTFNGLIVNNVLEAPKPEENEEEEDQKEKTEENDGEKKDFEEVEEFNFTKEEIAELYDNRELLEKAVNRFSNEHWPDQTEEFKAYRKAKRAELKERLWQEKVRRTEESLRGNGIDVFSINMDTMVATFNGKFRKFFREDFNFKDEATELEVPPEYNLENDQFGNKTVIFDHLYTPHQTLKHNDYGTFKVSCTLLSKDSDYLFVAILNFIEVWVKNKENKFVRQSILDEHTAEITGMKFDMRRERLISVDRLGYGITWAKYEPLQREVISQIVDIVQTKKHLFKNLSRDEMLAGIKNWEKDEIKKT